MSRLLFEEKVGPGVVKVHLLGSGPELGGSRDGHGPASHPQPHGRDGLQGANCVHFGVRFGISFLFFNY